MADSLTHQLHPHLPELARFNSTVDLHSSALFEELKPRIMQVLGGFEQGSFAPAAAPKEIYHAVAWNIERGAHFDGIFQILKTHPQLSGADLYLITESDLGMARSGNRNIARELAEALQLNYFFAPSYLNLSKGSGHEAEAQGNNNVGVHGNAILSRYPITNQRTVVLPNGKDKMRGREKRIGNQRALIAELQFGNQILTTACIHLDAHSSQRHRARQLRCVLEALPNGNLLMGGDWNTSTYNSSRAIHAIIGFWIRVLMGTGNMIRNHYPYPDRYWEKELFEMVEAYGLNYQDFNELGAGTVIYDIKDIRQYKNLSEWIPQWCFRFIEWSLKEHNGRCGLKLDWFAGRGLKPSHSRVVDKLIHQGVKVSDHEAIVTEFSFN